MEAFSFLSSMNQSISFAGDFEYSKAMLTSPSGAEASLLEMIHETTVYEDLFSPFITAEVLVEDQIGLYHKLPILGEEILTLTLTNPDKASGYKEFDFQVYKIKDFLPKGQRGFMYRLCLISYDAIKDMNLKISKSYSGNASDIVDRLLKKEGLRTEKKVFAEPSIGQIQYISNYWQPIKNLKYLCNRTVAESSKSPSYLFFENKDGFFFYSMAALKGQEPVTSLFYSERKDQSVEKSRHRVENLYIDVGIDYIHRNQNGGFGSTVVYVDPTKKTYRYRYLDFLEGFKNQPRLNELPMSSESVGRRYGSTFDLNVTPTYVKPKVKNEYSEVWYQERLMELTSIKGFQIQVEVAGDFGVSVGQTIDFYMYSGDVPDSRDLNEVFDPVVSGRYLVTAVAHHVSRSRHVLMLTLNKDSLTKRKQ